VSPSEGKQPNHVEYDPSGLAEIPVTYQAIIDHFRGAGQVNPYLLRKKTILRIERITGRPLLCYVTKTQGLLPGIPAYVDHFDLIGFGDLIHSIPTPSVDIFIISNGGSAETAERIVRLIRSAFNEVRFIVPHNAYSAATLMCFSGDELLMDRQGTLGPIDPQINGVPARAIIRAFEQVEERLKKEGPQALTAYMPLLAKYDLHLLEICKSAQEMSKELAKEWLSTYMLRCGEEEPHLAEVVEFFSSYDTHKSHGRSIDRERARELGLPVVYPESIEGLGDLIRSLHNQFEFFFDQTAFYKLFENAHGITWGRQMVPIQVPMMAPGPLDSAPLPGSPGPSG